MEWFTANWFWVLIFIAFIAMHMFGHGGHGGHSGHGGGGRQRSGDEGEKDDAQGRGVTSLLAGIVNIYPSCESLSRPMTIGGRR